MGQMGDQPWQRGTIHGAIVGPGGPPAVLQMVRGGPAAAAMNGPGDQFWGDHR